MEQVWSEWKLFPDPRKSEMLVAPFGAGCYELRLDNEKILFGKGGHVALRMTSLLPAPEGSGTRNNKGKRGFVLENLGRIEYRTLACSDKECASGCEAVLKANGPWRFPT
jgi:hypothetical protein